MQSIARAKLQFTEIWGLLFDESEDITNTEHEIVYIVYVSSESLPLTFWDLIELGGNRNAQAITDGLVRHFHDTGLND